MPIEDSQSVFIVGGFAANRWLYENLKKRLEPNGLYVCRPPDAYEIKIFTMPCNRY